MAKAAGDKPSPAGERLRPIPNLSSGTPDRGRRCRSAARQTHVSYKNGYVITSQFLGDLDDYGSFQYFKEFFAWAPFWSKARGPRHGSSIPDFVNPHYRPHRGSRHHHAHVLAPLLEHGSLPGRKVLGVALDGWGGWESLGRLKFLIAYDSYLRMAHFEDVPLPTGTWPPVSHSDGPYLYWRRPMEKIFRR